jgi:hypothetical protein
MVLNYKGFEGLKEILEKSRNVEKIAKKVQISLLRWSDVKN